MASWTTPTILTAGAPLPTTAYNGLANNTTFLYQAPYASYYDSVGTSIPSGADTIVQLGGTTFSNFGWVVNENTLTVPVTGIFQFDFRIGYPATSTGGGFVQLFHNGQSIIFGSWVTFSSSNYVSQTTGSGLLPCNAGDGLYLVAYQNSGSTLTTQTGSAQTALEVFFVGSQ